MTDPHDTIVALSTAPGSAPRAVVRLSGPRAVAVTTTHFHSEQVIMPQQRGWYHGSIRIAALHAPLPAELYVWPAPRSYTGQQLIELHTLSCPPLLDALIAQFLHNGARAAQPGEFTLRAFLAGKLDLARVEAVHAVIEAGSREELQQALTQLAGGVTRPLQALREDLLNLLADVEAALDFSDEDISFVSQPELLTRLARGLALVTNLKQQLDRRAVSERVFRAVLAGQPNVGKSSLFNALTQSKALVSAEPGTTRDYLRSRLTLDGVKIELIDTAGWQQACDALEEQAQGLGQEQAQQADLILLCVEAGQELNASEQAWLARAGAPAVVLVATKCDRVSPLEAALPTSAATGMGLDGLRRVLLERARAQGRVALAPSLSRCRHHVEACLTHLRSCHRLALEQQPPELLALELRAALDQLGEMVGAVYTEDLLDRIFSRFCIGK